MILVHEIGPIIWHLGGILTFLIQSYKYFSNVSCDIFNSSSRPEISVTWNVFLLYLL